MLYSMSMNFVLKQPSNIAQMRAHTAGIFFVICRKKRRKFYDMHLIMRIQAVKKISSAQTMEKEMILINR